MLRTTFRIPLRQTESLMASVVRLIRLSYTVPDGEVHVLINSTGLKVFSAGQRLQLKHCEKAQHSWRKLHLAVDADNFSIVAHPLTDPLQVGPLLSQVNSPIVQVTADDAPTYGVIARHGFRCHSAPVNGSGGRNDGLSGTARRHLR